MPGLESGGEGAAEDGAADFGAADGLGVAAGADLGAGAAFGAALGAAFGAGSLGLAKPSGSRLSCAATGKISAAAKAAAERPIDHDIVLRFITADFPIISLHHLAVRNQQTTYARPHHPTSQAR